MKTTGARRGTGLLRIVNVRIIGLFVILLVAPVMIYADETPCDSAYFSKIATSAKPTVHDIAERLRIAQAISPDRMVEFSGVHQQISYPGDSESDDDDDFLNNAYAQLRAEIRSAYAEVASDRAQEDEVQRSLDMYQKLVDLSNTLYGTGKIDQAQALQAQSQRAIVSENLLLLRNREHISSIRLNVLVGNNPEQPVPALVPLQEYLPNFDDEALEESYKSLRFLAVFQEIITPGSESANGIANGVAPHGGDSLDIESVALVRSSHIQMDSLLLQLHSYRLDLIPRGEQSYAARLESYKYGKADYSMLLESLQNLSNMRKEYQAMLGEMQVMKGHLEFVTGATLDSPEIRSEDVNK